MKPGITNELITIIPVVTNVILSNLIGLYGIATNIINMIVFYKQGFTTTVNISLFALALSDLLSLVTGEWLILCMNPFMELTDINFIPIETQYLNGGWFHVCFGRITSWITVYITAERCLSIALPLKVKQILSTRKTKAMMCIIFTSNLLTLVPEYSIAYLDFKFVPERNKTLIGLVYRNDPYNLYGLVYALTSASGMTAFAAVIILTTFLVVKLTQHSNWHAKVSVNTDQSEARLQRDRKIMKMVVMIASILIVCYIPGTVASWFSVIEREFNLGGEQENTFLIAWSVVFLGDVVNSSVNLLLYYNMSTKYRETFNQLFPMCRCLEGNDGER